MYLSVTLEPHCMKHNNNLIQPAPSKYGIIFTPQTNPRLNQK